MPNYHSKPGTDYAYAGSFRATAAEDLNAGDVVWVTARQGRRKSVSKASAVSAAVGLRGSLFVAVGGATAGSSVLVTPAMLVTSRTLTGDFNDIAALSGGSLGDPVYLSDTPGAVQLSVPASGNGRILGTYVDDQSWEFGPVAGLV